MNMGALAMIAAYRPKNLFHIILDNEAYESTGGQPTISNRVNLASIARAAGYAHALRFNRLDALKKRIGRILNMDGPLFILFKVENNKIIKVNRVSIPPFVLTERIRERLKGKII